MSHVVGKNRKELLAMAKGHGEEKKGDNVYDYVPLCSSCYFFVVFIFFLGGTLPVKVSSMYPWRLLE